MTQALIFSWTRHKTVTASGAFRAFPKYLSRQLTTVTIPRQPPLASPSPIFIAAILPSHQHYSTPDLGDTIESPRCPRHHRTIGTPTKAPGAPAATGLSVHEPKPSAAPALPNYRYTNRSPPLPLHPPGHWYTNRRPPFLLRPPGYWCNNRRPLLPLSPPSYRYINRSPATPTSPAPVVSTPVAPQPPVPFPKSPAGHGSLLYCLPPGPSFFGRFTTSDHPLTELSHGRPPRRFYWAIFPP